MPVPSAVQSYLDEPRVSGAPRRVARDWILVGAASIGAVLEALLRTDDEWTALASGWRVAALATFLVSVPPALLIRRSRPLVACGLGFGVAMSFGVLTAAFADRFSGLVSTAVILICLYAVFRWGSGREGFWAFWMAVAAGVIGNLTDTTSTLGDWIGGFIVLSIPIEVGLVLRYQRSARDRAIAEAQSREREEIARELHDTVAHHVSAIAVQAQAGRAIAATDPARAIDILAVIEEAASRTLSEMRAMVGTLRGDDEGASLAPGHGIADIQRLAGITTGGPHIEVSIDDGAWSVGSATQAAVYRIARESVTNAVRHAERATRIAVDVSLSVRSVRLTVEDDGHPAVLLPSRGEGSTPSGYGILGMAERAEMLGGTLDAGPAPGGGWRVVAELPRAASEP